MFLLIASSQLYFNWEISITDPSKREPAKFELIVYLGTACSGGPTVPPLILARADEVIE